MRRFSARAQRWAILSLALLATSCVGWIGAGVAAVAIGAGVVAYTCYDRVSVTVTDRLTGTKLCDAKVTFRQGESVTEATSCHHAALSKGKYTLRVERPGLETFEVPVEVVRGQNCGQTVQTVVVALDRANQSAPPQPIAPPATPAAAAPVPTAPPPSPAPPDPVEAPEPPVPSASPPPGEPTAPPTVPPSSGTFPQ